MKLCIDFGYSSTKWVLIENGKILDKSIVEKSNTIQSIIDNNTHSNHNIAETIATGGNVKNLQPNNVKIVNELKATCLGALFLSNKEKGLVVNAGTGTSITYCDGKEVKHEGGTGLGGGTILGLSKLLLGQTNFEIIENMAKQGVLDKIDLQVGDIVGDGIGILPRNITASNFGKLNSYEKEDLALGIINLVAENIASNAIQVARKNDIKNIHFSGRLANSQLVVDNINKVATLFGINFVIVENPEYATAVGCHLA